MKCHSVKKKWLPGEHSNFILNYNRAKLNSFKMWHRLFVQFSCYLCLNSHCQLLLTEVNISSKIFCSELIYCCCSFSIKSNLRFISISWRFILPNSLFKFIWLCQYFENLSYTTSDNSFIFSKASSKNYLFYHPSRMQIFLHFFKENEPGMNT